MSESRIPQSDLHGFNGKLRSENLAHNLAIGCIVSPEDIDLLEMYQFSLYGGYAGTGINGTMRSLHRLIHSRMIGKPLSEYTRKDHVRHIEPNGLDCRRSNLFVKTGATANSCDLNRPVYSHSTSGINGVWWDKTKKQWKVSLKYLNKDISLGYYDTLEQAARVACHCRITRSEITCSDTPMSFDDMKNLLQAEAKTI